jgi:hypothetical protein
MRRIKGFKTFDLGINRQSISEALKIQQQALNENVQAAKAYMISKFSKKKGQPLSKEDEVKILANPDYQEIKNNILPDNGGWLPAFLRFHFEQGVSLENLVTLRDDLVRYKSFLGALPMTVDQYAKMVNIPRKERIKKLEDNLERATEAGDDKWISDIENQIKAIQSEDVSDARPGIERLQDELRYIEKEREARWLIDGLPARAASALGKPVNLRDEYRNADKDLKDKVVNIGSLITKSENSEATKERFLKKVSSYNSLERLADFGDSFVKSLGSSIDKLSQQAESLYPGVAIMYEDNQYIALSLRSESAQKELCSAANWCINRGSFWSYAKGNVQLNIFNFDLPQTNRYFLVGITITPNGIVSTSHDVNDARISNNNENYAAFLQRLGYPEKMIDQIKDLFNREIQLKKITDQIYSSNRMDTALGEIIQSSYKYTDDPNFQVLKTTFYEILNQELNLGKVNRDIFKSIFYRMEGKDIKGTGIVNSVALELFRTIFPDPDSTYMKNVALRTQAAFKSAQDLKDNPANMERLAKSRPDIPKWVDNVLSEKDYIMSVMSPYLS